MYGNASGDIYMEGESGTKPHLSTIAVKKMCADITTSECRFQIFLTVSELFIMKRWVDPPLKSN